MRVLPSFLLSLFAAAAFADEECPPCPPRYSYCGYSGPAQWPNLPITNNQCDGKMQSPINLDEKSTEGDAIKVDYKTGDATIVNSGHDIRVIPKGDAGGITIGGKVYTLVNFHFHTPSEHQIVKVEAPAEIHFVHELESDHAVIAVIGVMLDDGGNTGELRPVFDNLPPKVCDKSDKVEIKFKELLPQDLSSYYTYVGSLTTPPCTEGVNWYVLDKTRLIDEKDLKKLENLGENARPIQTNPDELAVTYIVPKK